MNNSLSGSQETIERHGSPPKNGCGCLINSLIGIAVFAVAIVAAVWLVIMYTPLPLRFVTNLIEESGAESNLKITGVSGSLASGLSYKTMTWDDGEITDLRFRYSGIMDVIRRKELIIHEMYVGSATLNTTFFTDSPEETSQDAETESTGEPSTKGKSTEPPLRLLQIDRLSLNQIIIKNPSTARTITIPQIEWTGFKAEQGADLELGNLEADSDHLVIRTSTPASSDYQKSVDVTLMPKLDPRILKPIRIVADLSEKEETMIFAIKAFDETVALTAGSDKVAQLRASGTNLADFIDAPLPNKLHLDASLTNPQTADAVLTVRGGSFLLGIKSFEVQPTTSGPDENPESAVFLALCREGDTEIRYEIPFTKTEAEKPFTLILTSVPAMKPEDLMALLFHDQEFSTLTPADQEKLRKHMTWFSF